MPPRVLAVVVLGLFALAAWLDRDRHTRANQAAIFGAIVAAIAWLGQVLGVIGGAIASSVEAAVVYLASAVGWLGARVASIVLSTGTMFARVWEWVRRGYELVLKPALVWIHDVYTRVTAWLGTYFKPVFEFLSHVRTVLMDLYARFLRPILTALDIAHAVLRTLADFHIAWAATLDRYVTETQALITENFLKILGWLNEVRDVVNAVVTPDRLFQRLPLVRTLNRDVGYWAHIFWNAQIAPYISAHKRPPIGEPPPPIPPEQLGGELANVFSAQPNQLQANVDAIVPLWSLAAGLPV